MAFSGRLARGAAFSLTLALLFALCIQAVSARPGARSRTCSVLWGSNRL